MSEMQRLLRHLLRPHASTEAATQANAKPLRVVYFTSDWVAPVDAIVLPQLRSDVASPAANAQLVVLRHSDSSDAANGYAAAVNGSPHPAADSAGEDQAVGSGDFRALCKHFRITSLPACVLVDVSKAVIAEVSPSPDEMRVSFPMPLKQDTSVFQNLRAFEQSEHHRRQQVSESALVALRDQATSLFEDGDFVPAATRFVEVLLHSPDCTKSNFNLAVILQMMDASADFSHHASSGETYFAVTFMLQVVAIDDNDSVAHTVLRSVYYQEEPQAVLAGYRSIVAKFPHHVRAVHSLATLQGAAETAAPAYVREVFDELADTFEEKLVTHLEYRVPWLLVDALKKHEPAVFSDGKSRDRSREWRVADVGCGTGLCGRLLRPFVSHVVGVDISPLMIEKTREAGSYDELHTDDIGSFLSKRDDESLDLVMSADVWIYVGALEKLFALIAQKLKSTGWLVFSTELLSSDATSRSSGGDNGKDSASLGYKLAASGRFQHSEAYISTLAAANGFAIVLQEAIDVRKESGEAIPGRIYLLRKS